MSIHLSPEHCANNECIEEGGIKPLIGVAVPQNYQFQRMHNGEFVRIWGKLVGRDLEGRLQILEAPTQSGS